MPYTALQQMFDEANCWGQHYYEKSAYIAEITDDVIDVVVEHVPRKTSPLLSMLCSTGSTRPTPRRARTRRRSRAAGPRGTASFIIAAAPVRGDAARRAGVGAGVRRRAAPAHLDDTTYINAHVRVRGGAACGASYGAAKYERLAAIKGRYDPGNVFHRNMNIKPA